MKRKTLGKLLYYLLHATGFVLLYFVLRNFDWKSFGALFQTFRPKDFILGLSMLSVVYILKSLRWMLINRTFGIRLPYGTTFIYFLVAGFLSVITPGRLGEFSRIFFIQRKTGISTTMATSSVVLDRVWDVLVLSLLGGISALMIFGRFQLNTLTILAIAGFFLLALTVILFPALIFIPLKKIFHKKETLVTEMDSIQTVWSNNAGKLFIPGFVTTLIAFLALAVIPIIFTHRIGQDIGMVHSISAVSISNMLAFLPVTVGGFGTRELVFSEIWKILEFSRESAITISTAYFISNYFGSVIFGGTTYLVWFRKHFSLKELRKES